jgi:hypothetical protein
MRSYTVKDVEEKLIMNLNDLKELLLKHPLECSADQAVQLLNRYERMEEEILMMLSPVERDYVN